MSGHGSYVQVGLRGPRVFVRFGVGGERIEGVAHPGLADELERGALHPLEDVHVLLPVLHLPGHALDELQRSRRRFVSRGGRLGGRRRRRTRSATSWKMGVRSRRLFSEKTGASILRCRLCDSPAHSNRLARGRGSDRDASIGPITIRR